MVSGYAYFAIDSKRHMKSWFTKEGEKRDFRGMIGVAINPMDPAKFEDDYEAIMSELKSQFSLQTDRSVLKSSEMAMMFGQDAIRFSNFCLAFSRKVMALDDLKVTYLVTRINTKWLQDGKVIYGGEYGGPTTKHSVPEFIDDLSEYYNIVCAWKLSSMLSLRNSVFLLDGFDRVPDCLAWRQLRNENRPEVVFNGDRIEPLLSSCDLLLRSLDIFLKQRKEVLSENLVKDIVFYGNKVPEDRKFFVYVGNPDLKSIRPDSDRCNTLWDFSDNLRRPIMFVSAGTGVEQKTVIEPLPVFQNILGKAYGMKASVKFYDPKKDRLIIGRGEQPDYFVPLSQGAETQYEVLRRSGAKIERLDIKPDT